MAALKDRQYKLRTWANLSKITRQRLKSKIAKDKKDISALLGAGINRKKLELLLKQPKTRNFRETVKELMQ